MTPPTSYTIKVALKHILEMVTVVRLNQNITEVYNYGYQIKVTVSDDLGVSTNNWGVSIIVNTDDVNNLCYVEHRD